MFSTFQTFKRILLQIKAASKVWKMNALILDRDKGCFGNCVNKKQKQNFWTVFREQQIGLVALNCILTFFFFCTPVFNYAFLVLFFLSPTGLTNNQLLSACCAVCCVSGTKHHRSRCAAQCSTLPSSWVYSSSRRMVMSVEKKILVPSITALVSGKHLVVYGLRMIMMKCNC